MGKRAVLAAISAAILLIAGLPGSMLRRVDRCPVISPRLVSYRPSIRCEGQVYPAEGYQLLSSGLCLVEERYRSLGDPVAQGEVLAVLAPAAGEAVLRLQTQGSGVTRGDSAADLEALLKSYSGIESQPEELLDLWLVGEGKREGERIIVTSPVTGVVTGEVPVVGSVIKPGGEIAAVEGREGFFALVTVGEKDAGKISVGDQAVLSGEAIQGSCQGSVTRIHPGTRRELSGAVARNVVDIEVSLETDGLDPDEIRPGFSVKAQIFTDEERQMLTLPYEAIRQDPDNTEYVMVAGPSRLEKRPILTGQETADGVEVLEGLSLGELVALLPEGLGEGEEDRERYLLVYAEGG